MKITTRCSHRFIEVKVDEDETTIFNDNEDEAYKTAINLLIAAEEICDFVGLDFHELYKSTL